MIGYGEFLLHQLAEAGLHATELRAKSTIATRSAARIPNWTGKLALNLDRFVSTPLVLLGRSADIVHVIDPGNAVYLPLLRHRHAIVTVHDMIPYLAREGKLPGWRPSRMGMMLMDRIIRRLEAADRVICVSQSTRRDLLSLTAVRSERVAVIPNAVFQPMAPAAPRDCARLRSRLGIPMEAPLILHVGRNFYKNRETVLDVAARVRQSRKDMRLVLVGELDSALQDRARRLGVADAIHNLRHVAQEHMAALYCTAAVLLFPSHYEGFGLPVLEAQMCGIPVVCSDQGSLPEVLGRGCTSKASLDVDGLAEEVLRCIDTPLAEDERVEISREASSRFPVQPWLDAHLKLYRSLGSNRE